MKKLQHMLQLLNEDLCNERKHMNFYLFHASAVQGLHRAELREFLAEEAASEMKHVQEFQDLIIGLGGEPTLNCNSFETFTDPYDIISYALLMEDQVVANYVKRIRQSQKLDSPHGTWIEVFMEEQIMHSRQDADHMRQMVRE